MQCYTNRCRHVHIFRWLHGPRKSVRYQTHMVDALESVALCCHFTRSPKQMLTGSPAQRLFFVFKFRIKILFVRFCVGSYYRTKCHKVFLGGSNDDDI